jgi:transposase
MQSCVPTNWGIVSQEGLVDKPTMIGVDVSKDWLDFAVAGGGPIERIANTPEAVARLLDDHGPALVAFEPTGGYERVLQNALRDRGIVFVRVHPNDVIAFRKSRGIRAKTDRIDAGLIAAFAADELVRRGLRPNIAGDQRLRELVARRRQLVDMLQAERCRLELATAAAVRQSLSLVVDAITNSLEALEQEFLAHVAANPDLAQLKGLLQSVKGIGPITATTLIADLPELGLLNAKEIAALVGLAPNTRQSGKMRYRERTGHGRPAVRRVLFNAARSAIRHPSPLRTFYLRLVEQNQRPGKVALTAVMRKLLVTANAIARDRQPWKLNTA